MTCFGNTCGVVLPQGQCNYLCQENHKFKNAITMCHQETTILWFDYIFHWICVTLTSFSERNLWAIEQCVKFGFCQILMLYVKLKHQPVQNCFFARGSEGAPLDTLLERGYNYFSVNLWLTCRITCTRPGNTCIRVFMYPDRVYNFRAGTRIT